ncbi:MAG TPA: biotin--[acetyl-CoA-carboxylase] ligase [Solirubrobacterales bacterium]|nr:biotin--[acetyl-CoA-carboxylase] ligase [Solirubrobacterales bacterium]
MLAHRREDRAIAFGFPHRHYRLTDSTNERARELVEAGAPHGTVVTAEEQSAGRGRQGRVWTAPARKGLLYSAILHPLDERHLLLPLSVPLAVCEAAEALRPGIECRVKWPNDVWLEERKLAGILIEAKPQDGWAVIGVGLNLTVAPDEFPADLKWPATSLHSEACSVNRHIDRKRSKRARTGAFEALNRALDRWAAAPRDEVLAAWRSRDALRGREVSWQDGSGVAEGIDDSGDLLVRRLDGDLAVLGAGEVHLRL